MPERGIGQGEPDGLVLANVECSFQTGVRVFLGRHWKQSELETVIYDLLQRAGESQQSRNMIWSKVNEFTVYLYGQYG